jgi:hypothetical protein
MNGISGVYTYDKSISSLGEYIELIYSIRNDSSNENGETPHLWFRGHSDYKWKLIPAIQRILGHLGSSEFFNRQREMNTDFQSRASLFLETKPDMNDFSSWLQIMQHYGFPTRLLDWSRSPLYALYFATCDRKHDNVDGCIFILSPGLLNEYADLERRIYIYHMHHGRVKEIVYSAFKGFDRNDPEEVAKWGKYDEKIVACYATQKDARVFNQQSAFTVHNSLCSLTDISDEIYSKSHNYLLQRIIITSVDKKRIFDQLFLSGITHSTVLPDVENLTKDIKRIYGIE